MKNRFIQMFLVICAVMLTICAVSVWAAAEDMAATPTDLAPVGQDELVTETTEPETTEPEVTVPEITEPQEPVNETTDPEEPVQEEEEAADAVELIITKAVHVGDSWNGVMKKTKPAILKLDVNQAQHVNLLVRGRYVWITVEKADRVTDNPARTLTENSQAVISWQAEAGSYLITLGPVEPNLMAKANVSILNDAAYSEWLAQQQTEEVTEEEPTEVTKEETEDKEEIEEPIEEPAEEPEETIESEEPTEETVEEISKEETNEEETTDEPDEITEEETTETPADEEETGEEPDEENPEETEETGEETEENIPESEITPERHISVEITWDVPEPVIGDTAHFKATLEGYDGLPYSMQWQYSSDRTTWYDLPGETEQTMDVQINEENNTVYWRILVYVEDNQEE